MMENRAFEEMALSARQRLKSKNPEEIARNSGSIYDPEHQIITLKSLGQMIQIRVPEYSFLTELEGWHQLVKKVAEKMSDYAGAEKESLLKQIRQLSIGGVCALAVYFLLDITGMSAQNLILQKVYLYCETLIYVTMLLLPLYTTGLLEKLQRRKKNDRWKGVPKGIRMLVAEIIAFSVAAILKIFLTGILGI